jgi:small GTP-binding protein
MDLVVKDDPGPVKKILKVLIVGEMAVGKTALIRQYAHGAFSEFYKSTIGADFANKDVEWDSNTSLGLQLWDIGGQLRFQNMTHVYFQAAVAALVVFDLTLMSTLDVAKLWKTDIDSKAFTSEGKPIPTLLIGNKIDLCKEGIWARTEEEMQTYVEQNGFIGFMTTSARDATNIDEAFRELIKYVFDHNIEPASADDSGVDITAKSANDRPLEKQCCSS